MMMYADFMMMYDVLDAFNASMMIMMFARYVPEYDDVFPYFAYCMRMIVILYRVERLT